MSRSRRRVVLRLERIEGAWRNGLVVQQRLLALQVALAALEVGLGLREHRLGLADAQLRFHLVELHDDLFRRDPRPFLDTHHRHRAGRLGSDSCLLERDERARRLHAGIERGLCRRGDRDLG